MGQERPALSESERETRLRQGRAAGTAGSAHGGQRSAGIVCALASSGERGGNEPRASQQIEVASVKAKLKPWRKYTEDLVL